LHGAEIEAAPAGDEHQAHNFDFEELAEVVDEGCGGAGRRGVEAVRRSFSSVNGEVG
jgi:hypothetical protein